MKLRSVVMWRTRLGKRRPIRLYKARHYLDLLIEHETRDSTKPSAP